MSYPPLCEADFRGTSRPGRATCSGGCGSGGHLAPVWREAQEERVAREAVRVQAELARLRAADERARGKETA